MWLSFFSSSRSRECSSPLSYPLRELSPTYLKSFIFFSAAFCSSSSSTVSMILFSSLISHFLHQVSYTMFLFVQSWLNPLPVLIFVVHIRHPGRLQSWPCHGSDRCSKSTNLVPVFSTILIFIPVCLPNSSSAALSLLASSPPLV